MNRWMLALVALAVVLGGCGRTMVATPTIYWAEDSRPFANTAEEFKTPTAEVMYITDRARKDTESKPVWYGFGRSKSQAFGSCEVNFGRGMTWEQLEAASQGKRRASEVPISIGKVTEVGRLPAIGGFSYRMVDGQLTEVAQEAAERQRLQAEFTQELSRRVQKTNSGEVFLFVHGFHNEFQDPMFVTAQIWHFMGRDIVPIAYTWPAGWKSPALLGMLFGYNYDRESGEFSVFHLKHAIRAIASNPDVRKLHLIAHSRGTDVLITALRELNIHYTAAGQDTGEALKLGSVILAAPDIDMEVFSQRIGAERLPAVPERFTVYVSRNDSAIGVSSFLFKSKTRLGKLRYADLDEAQREAVKGFTDVNVVNVTAKTSGPGHSYFYDNPSVLSDLILTLRGVAPGESTGRPLILEGAPFWTLPQGYLCPN